MTKRVVNFGAYTLTHQKTLTSHAGAGRFLSNCDPEAVGCIPMIPEIPSPFAYSQMWTVYKDWLNRPVIMRETSHKHYEVWVVDGPIAPYQDSV